MSGLVLSSRPSSQQTSPPAHNKICFGSQNLFLLVVTGLRIASISVFVSFHKFTVKNQTESLVIYSATEFLTIKPVMVKVINDQNLSTSRNQTFFQIYKTIKNNSASLRHRACLEPSPFMHILRLLGNLQHDKQRKNSSKRFISDNYISILQTEAINPVVNMHSPQSLAATVFTTSSLKTSKTPACINATSSSRG